MRGFRALSAVVLAGLVFCVMAVTSHAATGGEALASGYLKPQKGKVSPILSNTFGYLPDQVKRFMYRGPETAFQVVDAADGKVRFEGMLAKATGSELNSDDMKAGDFTSFREDGLFVLHVGTYESWPFRISKSVYGPMVRDGLSYLQQARAGDGMTGFRAWTQNVSHLDDGLLDGNTAEDLGLPGKWFDLVGGWYDATDVRYWTSSWMALEWVSQVADRLQPGWDKGSLLAELKWGNALFLKTILPDGRVLIPLKESNYWTDNIIGSKDDREVARGYLDDAMACHLAYLELRLARVFRSQDAQYAGVMERAGKRIIANLSEYGSGWNNAVDSGLRALAYLEMFQATRKKEWLEKARVEGQGILALQEKQFVGGQKLVRGFIYSDDTRAKTPDMRAHEPVFLTALVELARVNAADTRWLGALKLYCREYLTPLSKQNPYHLVPARVFVGPSDGRKLGNSTLSFRYFRPEGDAGNATGINTSLLGQASVLMETGRLAPDKELVQLAWEQMNFILGMNPFCASTIEGAGNVPTRFVGGQGVTNQYPRLAGAVLNGFATTHDDVPILDNSWESSEYWLPQFGWLGRFLAASGVDTSATDKPMLPVTSVVKTGRQQQFYLATPVAVPAKVSWEIDGVPGGNDLLGTVVDGVYTAPQTAPTAEQTGTTRAILDIVAKSAQGVEVGRSRVRVIPEPATPGGVVLSRSTTVLTVAWSAAEGADTYNVELQSASEGFWRIYANTKGLSLSLPLTAVAGKQIRVVAVNHKNGYARPTAPYAVPGAK